MLEQFQALSLRNQLLQYHIFGLKYLKYLILFFRLLFHHHRHMEYFQEEHLKLLPQFRFLIFSPVGLEQDVVINQ